MGITHVIRAEEWLSSLPKHVVLYRGFGWETPVFCHLPLLRNADRSKISKRKNPVSLNFYRRAGYLPGGDAQLPRAHGLGDARRARGVLRSTSSSQAFTLERISLGGPVFDVEKLKWLNGKYLRRLSPPELLERLRAQLLSEDHLLEVLPLVQERIDTLEGFFEYASFFFIGEVAYDADALEGDGPEGPHARPTSARRCGRCSRRRSTRSSTGRRRRSRRRSAASARRRLGAERALHGGARGRHRPRRLAASLRDPRRPRQGDLPAPPAPRRRRRSRLEPRNDDRQPRRRGTRAGRLHPRDRRRGPRRPAGTRPS